MKRSSLSFTFVLLLALIAQAHADQEAKEILKAVVKIRAVVPEDARSAKTLGTEREGNGVVIDAQGHILTIGYLILEAETIEVFASDQKPVSATFIGYDHNTGFGLLRADKPLDVAPLEFGQSSEVKEGDPVLVMSYGGQDSAQSARVVSRREFVAYWEYLLEEPIFSAPAHSNFGGAALIDRHRRLVGIGSLLTQVMIPGFGAIPGNMFVPIDLLKPLLPDLIAKGRSSAPPRPWLGLNSEEAHGRVIVTRVMSDSPAEKAGLRIGDIVLAVNKKEVAGQADFYRQVWALGNAGVEVPLRILQGVQVRDVTIRSADRYQLFRSRQQKKI